MAPGFFVVFCLISSVLLTGVTSLKCYVCFTTNRDCRNEDMTLVECEKDEIYCISLTSRTTFSTPPVSYTTKNCAKPEEVNDDYYSITSEQGKYFELVLRSCQSDGCNAMPLGLPPREDLQPNELICPGSYTKHGDSPQPSQPILCLGFEDQCGTITFGMETYGAIHEKAVVQGCFTKGVCSYPIGETQMGKGIVKFNVIATQCDVASRFFDKKFFNM